MTEDPFQTMGERGGPVPTSGSIGESFRAGFYDLGGTLRRGSANSIRRKAYNAGRRRFRVEPDALRRLAPVETVIDVSDFDSLHLNFRGNAEPSTPVHLRMEAAEEAHRMKTRSPVERNIIAAVACFYDWSQGKFEKVRRRRPRPFPGIILVFPEILLPDLAVALQHLCLTANSAVKVPFRLDPGITAALVREPETPVMENAA